MRTQLKMHCISNNNKPCQRAGLLPALLICGLLATAFGCRPAARGTVATPEVTPASSPAQAGERLAAPGILEPRDGSLALAAPVGPLGITPRVEQLYVQVGDIVQRGQVLARFDNDGELRREIDTIAARINGLGDEIAILDRQTQRFDSLRAQGVVALADFEDRALRLSQLRNNRALALQERRVLEERLRKAQLVAPISGEVLAVNARPGEQAGPDGVLELAATDNLVVKAQVEEASAGGLTLGQPVEVVGENAEFPQPLGGRISFIAAKVSPRRTLTQRPGFYRDSEPRVVDVTIDLEPAGQSLGRHARSGSKVLVIFLGASAAEQ